MGNDYKDFTKEISKKGWVFHRNGKGSHMIWKCLKTGKIIPIPKHKNIKKGTLNKLKKDTGE